MSGLKIKTNKNYANLSFESAEGRTWIIQNWNNGNEFGVFHNDTSSFNFYTNAEGDLRVKRNGVFQGSVTASSFIGNADTASKWLTPRTLTIGGTGKSVDGSGNVSWSIDEIGCAYKYTDGFWRSLRDFTIGTLIQTSIDWV